MDGGRSIDAGEMPSSGLHNFASGLCVRPANLVPANLAGVLSGAGDCGGVAVLKAAIGS